MEQNRLSFLRGSESISDRAKPAFENIEVQGNDVLRDVLEAKYGIRHVPVIEVGGDGKFEALLEPDLEKLAELLARADEATAV